MSSEEAAQIERNNEGVFAIESEEQGLIYFTDRVDSCQRRLVIAGKGGRTLLTRKQAVMLARELPQIIETYLNIDMRAQG